MGARRTVTTSVMITQFRGGAQGQMSHRAVEKLESDALTGFVMGRMKVKIPARIVRGAHLENREGCGSLSRGGAKVRQPTFRLPSSGNAPCNGAGGTTGGCRGG
jgi:hypothetical protein